MKVTANTTTLYFVSPQVSEVDVTITNQQSKKVTFQGTLTATQESFYNSISDANFNFAKDQTYILDIKEAGQTVYRATIYSDFTDVVVSDQNSVIFMVNNKALIVDDKVITLFTSDADTTDGVKNIKTDYEYITV